MIPKQWQIHRRLPKKIPFKAKQIQFKEKKHISKPRNSLERQEIHFKAKKYISVQKLQSKDKSTHLKAKKTHFQIIQDHKKWLLFLIHHLSNSPKPAKIELTKPPEVEQRQFTPKVTFTQLTKSISPPPPSFCAICQSTLGQSITPAMSSLWQKSSVRPMCFRLTSN